MGGYPPIFLTSKGYLLDYYFSNFAFAFSS
jgi:hypothetical protein